MATPLTAAQVVGLGACWFLHDVIAAHTTTTARISLFFGKGRTPSRWKCFSGALSSFSYSARADTCRAHAHMLAHACDDGLHAPQVGIPSPPPEIVRVAHGVSVTWLLTAHFANQRHS